MDDLEDDEMPYGLQDYEDEFDDEREFTVEDEFEDAMMNCGMMENGLCMKAGSEECDWECPFSN
jgi:hypothetical protein